MVADGPEEVAEELVVRLGQLLRESLIAQDLCGRLGGAGFMVLIERGTSRDVEVWAEQLMQRIAAEAFRAGDDAANAGLLYRALFQRPPTQRETLLATEFVRSTPRGGEDDRGEWRYGRGDPAAASGSP